MGNPKHNKRTTRAGAKPPVLKEGSLIAVIRIRGAPKMSNEMEQTLHYLHLPRRHSCIIIANNPTTLGMIKKVQNYITWGEVTDDVVKQLESKALKNKAKNSFGLKSPRKDMARKGIKLPRGSGGALGFRKDMGKLITRMI
jgi:ribosomal protein L30/L7E